ncbi:LytTR family transcriptional regulator DNA-binding domain-containing protein [Sphingomonas astaxanthinifaciens]|uniref:LytTr DNA-binding domain protein n=1 Tax=Sphingomonas astaxanthinifaciens DSM 22298 TaxID=1123267 RepID=A0ABQ5Z3T9_9SPHN|nr:LytTR family transcriptional regulator DNA-binding domain-containing protein [Sphingomonas astaxanthinifaciens]GLR47459.1 LytTr DNA-binding domain protein [Sphingomonas astaxanthinifaciens DSM 22298]
MNRSGGAKGWLREGLVSLAVVALVGLVLAALGPFGSFANGSFVDRLGYWLAAVLVGFCVFRPIVFLADWAVRSLDLPRAGALVAAVLVAALPGTLAIAWLNGALRGGMPPLGGLAPLYLNVAIVGALVTGLFVALEKRPVVLPAEPSPQPPIAPVSRPAFLDRLPPDWRGELRALEMEDHYVRAHGPQGRSHLLLMRMADAERELSGVEGERVHRSWWIARAAVEGVRRDGRRLFLRLGGGLEAPVSRDRVPALRQRGWL